MWGRVHAIDVGAAAARWHAGVARELKAPALAIINRPPTGGDLTFSWKEGHICTVVLLEVLSQLCHGGGGVQALSVVGGRQSRTRV